VRPEFVEQTKWVQSSQGTWEARHSRRQPSTGSRRRKQSNTGLAWRPLFTR